MDASTFSSRIGTNYAATDEEIIYLKKHLSERTVRLAKFQDEVDRAHATYIELRNKQESLSHYIEEHRALVAPIRHLPVDILQEIFHHCLPTGHNSIMSRHEPPMLLTQICSSWRLIAHSTASLWASIHFPIPNNNYPFVIQPPSPQRLSTFQKRIVAMKEWLGRSGACPLSISIFDNESNNPDSNLQELHRETMDFLISLSRRWANIDFRISRPYLHRLLAMSEGDVPSLRSLSISRSHQPNTDPVPDPKFWKDSVLLRGPQLSKIAYSGHDNDLDFSTYPLQWRHLTEITLNIQPGWFSEQTIDYSKVHLLLRSCPLLVNFSLDAMSYPDIDRQEAASVPPISLPHLRQLSIRCNIGEISLLSMTLDLPSLLDLGLYSLPSESNTQFASRLALWLSKLDTTLRKFSMDPYILGKAQFLQSLRSCPNVTTLCLKHLPRQRIHENMAPPPRHLAEDGDTVIGYHVDDQLLHDLINQDHSYGTLLPNLIELECYVGGEISDLAIIDFVKARRSKNQPGVATISLLSIRLERPQTMPMLEELRPYVEDGLLCHLSYLRPRLEPPKFSLYSGIDRDIDLPGKMRMGTGQWHILEG